MKQVKINYNYFQECIYCGFRYTLQAQNIDNHGVVIFERDEDCPTCQKREWVVDVKVNKEEILPKI